MCAQIRTSLLCCGLLLALCGAISGQQSMGLSADQLRRQIQDLESLDRNPTVRSEMRDVNRRLLNGRRSQLQSLLQKRHNALQRQLRAVVPAGEANALEASVRSLGAEIARLKDLQSQAFRPSPASVQNRTQPPTVYAAHSVSRPRVNYTLTPKANSARSTKPRVVEEYATPPTAGNTARLVKSEQGSAYAPAAYSFKREAFAGTSGSGNDANSAVNPNPPQGSSLGTSIEACRGKIKGEKTRGPATVTVRCVNPVKYDNQLEETVSFPPAPDLTLLFIPPVPAAATKPVPPKSAGASENKLRQLNTALETTRGDVNDLTAEFNRLLDRLRMLEAGIPALQDRMQNAIDTVNRASDDTTRLVDSSDAILNTGGPSAVMRAIPPVIASIATAIRTDWPDAQVTSRLAQINDLKNSLNTLPSVYSEGWSLWYDGGNKTSYDYVKARLDQLEDVVEVSNRSGESFRKFEEAKSKLRLWRPILNGVNPGSFVLERRVGCGFAFDTGKEVTVKHFKRERFTPNAQPTSESEVIVVCSSPISVSAGVGFTFVDEKVFGLVQSRTSDTDPTIIQRFGFTSRSRFRPIPAILLNTRIHEFNDTIALHGSLGAVVDVASGQGGADLEFIAGPSVSFMRTLFVTPGVHIGRVPELAGGFKIGDKVPSDVSAPPLEKSWKSGFMTTITYKIR